MQRAPVVSSTIASVGYDEAAYVLEVEFSGGRVYQYLDVPEAVYLAFISAPSLGQYLNANIKGTFRYTLA